MFLYLRPALRDWRSLSQGILCWHYPGLFSLGACSATCRKDAVQTLSGTPPGESWVSGQWKPFGAECCCGRALLL